MFEYVTIDSPRFFSNNDALTELNKLNIEETSQKTDIPDVLTFLKLRIVAWLHEKQDKTGEKNYRLISIWLSNLIWVEYFKKACFRVHVSLF